MAENRSAPKSVKKAARSAAGKASALLTDEERAAMKEHVQELKRVRGGTSKVDDEKAVLAKIAAMKGTDRTIGKRVHAIVKRAAPGLSPKLWYGMPAYANEDGQVVCFFQDAAKFKARYATLGFNSQAHLDDGDMWPTSFALKGLTAADEAKVASIVKKAAS